MDPQLREIKALVTENNKILRRMQTAARWARFFNILYWVVIIGIALGSFYYIQPYFKKILDFYNAINKTLSGLPDLTKIIPP